MYKRIFIFSFLTFMAFMSIHAFTFESKKTYSIYLSPAASNLNRYSAAELSKYVKLVFHSDCTLRTSSLLHADQLVLVDNSHNLSRKETPNMPSSPGIDGFSVKATEHSISIQGGNSRGLLYGVYSLLEEKIGCKWYSKDCQVIPTYSKLKLNFNTFSYNPPVKWRSVLYYELSDPYLAGVLKLNGNAQRQILRQTNRYTISEGFSDWGYWCHSLYNMVSPDLYGSHPEYFAEVNGQRVRPEREKGGTQLCLTNPDVEKITIEQLSKAIKKPSKNVPIWADSLAYYWSVSQMDGNGFCTCPKCTAIDKYEDGHSGSILNFVNKVASHFPDKKIATLAYIYSRKAPIHIKPASNVAIQLCAIETARDGINRPIATSPIHASFRKDLVDWGKICNDIIIWDYEIQFQNLVSPFPNLNMMQSNIQFYVEHHATGIFCQGNRERGGEFSELRGYLLSKLLWNPNCDIESLKHGFITAYYGKAAPYIEQYINRMESELKKSGLILSMDGEPEDHRNGYLSNDNIAIYDKLFDDAEAATIHDSTALKHVQKERMSLMYAQLKLNYGTIAQRKQTLLKLLDLAQANNVWMFSEVDWRPDQSGTREMFKNKMLLLLNK